VHTQVPITHDALRMRTRRLCEKKNSGRCGVPDAIHNDYVEGGEKREILEMSLLQCLATHGLDRKWYKRVKVVWLQKGSCWHVALSYMYKTLILHRFLCKVSMVKYKYIYIYIYII